MIAEALKTPVLVLLVITLLFNLSQRWYLIHGEKKRFASLGIAGVILLVYASILTISRFSLSDALLLVPAAAAAILLYVLRNRLFLFSFHCPRCGKPLQVKKTLYFDSPLCDRCDTESIPPSGDGPKTVEEIDWEHWVPDEDAVLCFIRQDFQVLLINKKTGLGAGKINAPGGRIENGETAMDAAIRETEEEISVTPGSIRKCADLSFEFTNGYSLHASAFFADAYTGEPTESDEAKPFWCSLDEIPFEKMWEDDRAWLPLALDGKLIQGRFIFDGDVMLSKDIIEVESFSG